MPRSKRSNIVTLTKTEKKSTRAHKEKFVGEVQEHAQMWKFAYIVDVGNMRNSALKILREKWKGTARLFFGRTRVMAAALGTSEDTECRAGISALARHLRGPVGLFFTNSDPKEVDEWFQSFQIPDFARSGNVATERVVLPVGPIVMYNDPTSTFPSSMDPQLRKLGLTTVLKRGVPSLDTEHIVCKKDALLSKEQAQLLKLIGVQMAVFKVTLAGRWSEDEGWVEMAGLEPPPANGEGEADGEAEEMDDD